MANSGDVGPRPNLPGESQDWGRWVNADLDAIKRKIEALEINLGGTTRALGGAQIQMAAQGESVNAANVQPLPPANLQVIGNVGLWRSSSEQVSLVTVSWSPVTQGTRGEAARVIGYEVWAGEPEVDPESRAHVKGTTATIEFQPGEIQEISVRALGSNGVWSSLSREVVVTTALPPSIVPKPPTGVTVSQVGTYSPGGAPSSRISLDWPPVTESTDNAPVTIEAYEVWERIGTDVSMYLTTVTASDVSFTVPASGSIERGYRIRALSTIGVMGDPSVEATITPTGPAAEMTPPSDPTLTPGIATIEVSWDGKMLGGTDPGSWVANVLTEVSTASSGPWSRAGAPLSRSGSNQVRGEVGTPLFFRFYTTDSLGRRGGTSGVVSASVTGVATLGNLVPNGAFESGIAGWYGAGGLGVEVVQVADGPNASTTNVARLTPTTADGGLRNVATVWGDTGAEYTPGASYAFQMVVRVVSGTAGSISMRTGLSGMGQATLHAAILGTEYAATGTPGAWVTVNGTFVAPQADPRTVLGFDVNTVNAAGTVFEVASVSMRQMTSAELIVDGAVKARHVDTVELWANQAWIDAATVGVLRAGVIETPMLSAGFAESLQLQANGSITMLVGRVDQNATDIAGASSVAAAAQATADDAALSANGASAIADGAVAQALEARNVADQAKDDLALHQTVYQFTTSGAIISTPNGEQALLLEPDRVSLVKSGQVLTYWEGQQMVVQEGVFDGINVAWHRIEADGTGKTTIRPL